MYAFLFPFLNNSIATFGHNIHEISGLLEPIGIIPFQKIQVHLPLSIRMGNNSFPGSSRHLPTSASSSSKLF